MNVVAITALVVSGAAFLVGSWALLRSRELEAAVRGQAVPAVPAAPAQHANGTVLRDSARDRVMHFSWRQVTWPQIVAEFYNLAIQDEQIADYFPSSVDLARLQDHFAKAMTLVTNEGLGQGVIDAMARKHARVVNSRGEPISLDVYNRTVGLLVRVLARHGVPQAALDDLARTIEPLRGAIVGVPR